MANIGAALETVGPDSAPLSHQAILEPNHVSGQLSNSATNGVFPLRPVQQRKPLNI